MNATSREVALVDYGAGNMSSVREALLHAGVVIRPATRPEDIDGAPCVVLPGVGDGSYMMRALHDMNLVSALQTYSRAGRPLLGICVGAQIMLSRTNEGGAQCLDLIPGECLAFKDAFADVLTGAQGGQSESRLKIPHMGWNAVTPAAPFEQHPLFEGIPRGSLFYFVNSYYPRPAASEHALARTEYGISFASIIGTAKTVGMQFHPEKSGEQGLRLIRNFLANIAEVI